MLKHPFAVRAMHGRGSIKNKLILTFVIILLISSFTMGQIFYRKAENKISSQMMQSSRDSVTLLNNLLTSTLTSTMNNVDNLSRNLHASLYSEDGLPLLQKYLDEFQHTHPEITSTYIGTEAGLTFIAPYQKIADDYDPRTRPWYQDAMKDKGKVYITEPYPQMDNATNQPTGNVIVSIVKVTADGSGVVGVDLNLSTLSETAKKVKIGQKGFVTITDAKGKTLVHPTLKPGTDLPDGWVRQVLAKDSGELEYTHQGQGKKMTFSTNELTDWKLVGEMDEEEVKQEASEINQTIYLITILSILIGSLLIYLIVRSITNPLSVLAAAAEKISQGDFTQKVNIHRNDEVGKLAHAFNHMGEELREIIHTLREKSETLAASSEELTASTEQTNQASNHIAFAMQEVAVGTERQISSVNAGANAINNMSSGIKQIAANAEEMNKLAAQASERSLDGGRTVETAANQMNSISSTVHELSEVVKELGIRSNEIGKITEVITGIAAQTNLLSLNAALEAARAGEHGQGFAVVAKEVRKLAEQSAQSAQQISHLIAMIQEKTKTAVKSMDSVTHEVSEGILVMGKTGKTFDDIQLSVSEVNQQIEQVASAVHHMTDGSQKVLHSIAVISKVVEETSAGVQSVSAAAEEQLATMDEISTSSAALAHMAEELQLLISKFKI